MGGSCLMRRAARGIFRLSPDAISAAAPVIAKRVPLARSNRAGEEESASRLLLDLLYIINDDGSRAI